MFSKCRPLSTRSRRLLRRKSGYRGLRRPARLRAERRARDRRKRPRRKTGGGDACIASLEQSLEHVPSYAPAILALGSIDYQLDDLEQGRRRLFSLLDLADHERAEEAPDLAEILDLAGDFLISRSDYRDGFELYRQATSRFPSAAALHQGLSLCAGKQGHQDIALAAAEAALALEPDNQALVNNMGWTLYERGEPDRALPFLQRAVVLDPKDALAAADLPRGARGTRVTGSAAPAPALTAQA